MALPVAPIVAAGTSRALGHLAAPGTWLTGAQRVAFAAEARRALAGEEPTGDASAEVVHAVALAPEFVTEAWLDDVQARGVSVLEFVETVGIVSRVAAIDTAAVGLGTDTPTFPDPVPGAASERENVEAERTTAFVPIAGRPGATSALSGVLRESEAQEDLSTAYYMGYQEMDEPDQIKRGLHRRQIELVAARTSFLNDCYY